MALPITVPYVFGNVTSSIPLTNLDSDFATIYAAVNGIGNGTVALANVTITGGSIQNVSVTLDTINNTPIGNTTPSTGAFTSLTDTGLTSGRVTYATTSGLLTDSANLTFNGTTLTTANDASISGLTVGKGGGSVSTNTAFGSSAIGSSNSGGSNTGIGYLALTANTSGVQQTAVGAYAAYTTTSGTANSAFGYAALGLNTTGANNVTIGNTALYSNTTASNNTAVGYQAGYNITTGGANVFVGAAAGTNLATGVYGVYVGYGATASSSSASQEIVLGIVSATGKGTNTGFIAPNGGGVYQGNNSTLWSITSDARLKKNIVDNNTGLSVINAIQVRNFEYRLPEEVTEVSQDQAIEKTGIQLGAIAQELQAILPDCVKTESTGVMSVDASNLTWYLINAVKELNAKITALEAQLGTK